MSENESAEHDEKQVPDRKHGLGDLADDAAHPFDQTNGLIDGLEGDADEPEKFEERVEENDEGE